MATATAMPAGLDIAFSVTLMPVISIGLFF
jgi:hypothetical protein